MKGTHIATVGPVQVSWFTGQAAVSTLFHASPTASAASPTDPHKNAAMPDAPPDDTDSHMHHEEAEPDTGGWGGDDDGDHDGDDEPDPLDPERAHKIAKNIIKFEKAIANASLDL